MSLGSALGRCHPRRIVPALGPYMNPYLVHLAYQKAALLYSLYVVITITPYGRHHLATHVAVVRSTSNPLRALLRMLLIAQFFLPGSRAWLVTTHGGHDDTMTVPSQMEARLLKSEWHPDSEPQTEASMLKSIWHNYPELAMWLVGGLTAGYVVSALCCMMPGNSSGAGMGRPENFNYRIPPSWSPDNDSQYSFRAYMTDISLWVMLTDLAPHQQCAAIIMRLGGQARELARMISPQEIVAGGWRDGQLLDPVTYLLGALQRRFANLEEETRLQSMTEMLAFARKPDENINTMLARYEVVRQRAANEGRFVMSIEGCALQVLRATGVQPHQLTTLLHQFGGRLPMDETEYQSLLTLVRRQGHITEAAPGNIATILQGPFRQAKPGAYFAEGATDQSAGQQLNSYWAGQNWSGSAPAPATVSQQPVSSWNYQTSGGQSSEGGSWTWTQPQASWPTNSTFYDTQEEEHYGDSSATSSDSGNEELPLPAVSGMSQTDATSLIYMQMRNAKRVWRRYTQRPVRQFRNTIGKFFKGKGKGKGKSGSGSFMFTQDDVVAFLTGKGKGGKSHTSGKGFGRTGNPKDRNGDTMTCHGCGSDQHLIGKCPQKGKGKGGPPSLFTGWGMRGRGSQVADATMQPPSRSRFPPVEASLLGATPVNMPSSVGLPSAPASEAPPWTHGDLRLGAPVTAPTATGYGYMNLMAAGRADYSPNAFPVIADALDAHPTGGLHMGGLLADPMQNSTADPWAGRSAGPQRPAPVSSNLWHQWRPTSDTGLLYGPHRSGPSRAHSAPAESRSSPWASDAPTSWQDMQTSPAPESGGQSAEAQTVPTTISPATAPHTPHLAEGTQAVPTIEMSAIHRALGHPRWTGQQSGPAPRRIGPGFNTPLQPRPLHYSGPPAPSALSPEVRQGESMLSESHLQSLMTSCTMSNSMRPATSEMFRPQYMRATLPLSSLAAYGATPSPHTMAHPPMDTASPLNRVTDSIRLAAEARAKYRELTFGQNQGQRSLQAAPADQTEASVLMSPRLGAGVGPMSQSATPTPPHQSSSLPQTPQTVTPRPSEAPVAEPTPVIYEGNEQTCSLCQEQFLHNHRVCRLQCRHMFHAQCWEGFTVHQNTAHEPHQACPNCRGSSTLIAVWPYIQETIPTQTDPATGGSVPNELVPGGASPMIVEVLPERTAEEIENSLFGSPLTPVERDTPDIGMPDPAPFVSLRVDPLSQEDGTYFVPQEGGLREIYHVQTRLADGRLSMILDIGSVGNLGGDRWAKEVAQCAARNGKHPTYEKRQRPLNVSGVGNGSQQAPFDCTLPIGLRHSDGTSVSLGSVTTPTVSNSDLPGLLGLTALRKNRAILDLNTMKLYFVGPGDYNLDKAMPPGTDSFQCEQSPSGHMVVPCCEYSGADQNKPREDSTLTLMTKPSTTDSKLTAAGPPGLSQPHYQ